MHTKNMNKLKTIAIGCFLFLFTLFGCGDLEEKNTSVNDTSDLTSELILRGAYSSLRSQFVFDASGYPFIWGDVGVDVFSIPRFNPSSIRINNIRPENIDYLRMWRAHYEGIVTVNRSVGLLNQKFNSGELEADEFMSSISQARFLRAVLYFNLVKAFERPVLLLETDFISDINDVDLSPKTNATPTEVYKAIEEDLLFGIENLPDPMLGRASVASNLAAKALLGKVYLQIAGFIKNDIIKEGFNFPKQIGLANLSEASENYTAKELYAKASGLFSEVIVSGQYSLMKNYKDIFQPASESSNTEMIFSVGFVSNGAGDGSSLGDTFGVFTGPPNGSFFTRSTQYEFVLSYFDGFDIDDTTNFAQVFGIKYPLPINDQRFLVNVSNFNVRDVNRTNDINDIGKNERIGAWSTYKYIRDLPANANNVGDRDFDFPYLRYADVLLMQAEAIVGMEGDLAEAMEFVNIVRRRAFALDDFNERGGVTPGDISRMNINPDVHRIVTDEELRMTLNGNNKDRADPTIKVTAGLAVDVDMTNIVSERDAIAAILRERRKELCYEGHRRDDLVRNGVLEEVVSNIALAPPSIFGARTGQFPDGLIFNVVGNATNPEIPGLNFQPHMYRLPIPQQERDLNSRLKQNSGYAGAEN